MCVCVCRGGSVCVCRGGSVFVSVCVCARARVCDWVALERLEMHFMLLNVHIIVVHHRCFQRKCVVCVLLIGAMAQVK